MENISDNLRPVNYKLSDLPLSPYEPSKLNDLIKSVKTTGSVIKNIKLKEPFRNISQDNITNVRLVELTNGGENGKLGFFKTKEKGDATKIIKVQLSETTDNIFNEYVISKVIQEKKEVNSILMKVESFLFVPIVKLSNKLYVDALKFSLYDEYNVFPSVIVDPISNPKALFEFCYENIDTKPEKLNLTDGILNKLNTLYGKLLYLGMYALPGWSHNDLNISNILYDDFTNEFKVIDLGRSQLYNNYNKEYDNCYRTEWYPKREEQLDAVFDKYEIDVQNQSKIDYEYVNKHSHPRLYGGIDNIWFDLAGLSLVLIDFTDKYDDLFFPKTEEKLEPTNDETIIQYMQNYLEQKDFIGLTLIWAIEYYKQVNEMEEFKGNTISLINEDNSLFGNNGVGSSKYFNLLHTSKVHILDKPERSTREMIMSLRKLSQEDRKKQFKQLVDQLNNKGLMKIQMKKDFKVHVFNPDLLIDENMALVFHSLDKKDELENLIKYVKNPTTTGGKRILKNKNINMNMKAWQKLDKIKKIVGRSKDI